MSASKIIKLEKMRTAFSLQTTKQFHTAKVCSVNLIVGHCDEYADYYYYYYCYWNLKLIIVIQKSTRSVLLYLDLNYTRF